MSTSPPAVTTGYAKDPSRCPGLGRWITTGWIFGSTSGSMVGAGLDWDGGGFGFDVGCVVGSISGLLAGWISGSAVLLSRWTPSRRNKAALAVAWTAGVQALIGLLVTWSLGVWSWFVVGLVILVPIAIASTLAALGSLFLPPAVPGPWRRGRS